MTVLNKCGMKETLLIKPRFEKCSAKEANISDNY
jgi:hypothetical protein